MRGSTHPRREAAVRLARPRAYVSCARDARNARDHFGAATLPPPPPASTSRAAAYVLQAAEDARWLRRHKEALDGERALMAAQAPGWIVNRPRYLTQAESRPDLDVLDARKIGPW